MDFWKKAIELYKKGINIEEKILQSIEKAHRLINVGYELNEVYKLIGREISLKEVKQIAKGKEDIELSH